MISPCVTNNNFWPSLPIVDCLPLQKLYYFTLGLILENKGTIKGTYSVLKNIFSGDNDECGFEEGQLGYKDGLFNNSKLVLINGD